MENSNDFLHWTLGLLEYIDVNNLTGEKAKELLQGIKDHQRLITKKITPTPASILNRPQVVKDYNRDYQEEIRRAAEIEKLRKEKEKDSLNKIWPSGPKISPNTYPNNPNDFVPWSTPVPYHHSPYTYLFEGGPKYGELYC